MIVFKGNIGRFDSVVNAVQDADLAAMERATVDNIAALNGIIRDAVKTVAKYTKQRSELELLLTQIEEAREWMR